eukprot:GEMP01032667.1.p1 GENE.GEMP01032667.1~~GEMP01032667.1.p1  ORF type:complete len:291 (+),score=61.35 GEMP01032667.1:283-1155(+)
MLAKKDLSALRASMARALESPSCDAGKVLFANAKYKEASAEFAKGIAADPQNASLRSNLTLCYLKLENYAAALELAEWTLQKLDLTDKPSVSRKLMFRRALAKEGLGDDGTQETEDLRRMALAYDKEGKPAEAKAVWQVFHRLVKSQRMRHLKEAARADGWAIDSPREETATKPRVVEKIDINSDYFRVQLPAQDREIKTIRMDDDEEVVKLPATVEERLRAVQAEEVTLLGRDMTVRQMCEPIQEWDPTTLPQLVGEEKAFEPHLKLFAEFHDRARWRQELMDRWAKYG